MSEARDTLPENDGKSGSFLPSGTISFKSTGEIFSNGERIDNRYPGFEYCYEGGEDRLFEDPGCKSNQVIEVFGENYRDVDPSGKPILRQNVIAVLKGDDAKLYQMLQWKDAWRGHSAVGLGKFFQTLFIFVVLFAVHVTASVLLLPIDGLILKLLIGIVGGIICSIVEIYIFSILTSWFTWLINFFGVYSFVKESINRNGRSAIYYKELFITLAGAACRDKAEAARTMSKVF